MEPYGERVWWQRGLATPFECGREAPLMDVIRRLMWRNTKAAVVDQLGLPPQHEQISTLRFKEVEAYWCGIVACDAVCVCVSVLSCWLCFVS